MCKFLDHLKRFIPLLIPNIKSAWENSRPSYQEAWKGAFLPLPIPISDLSGLANDVRKTVRRVRKKNKKRRTKRVNKKAKSKRKARNK